MKYGFAVILVLCIGQSAGAAELTAWQLPVRLSFGHGTDLGSAAHGYLEIEPAASASLASGMSVELSARARLDWEDRLEPGRPSLDTWSDLSSPVIIDDLGTLALRDAYIEMELRNGVARIGKQQIVWGRLDGIKVLDVLNPQSFREFILEDFGHSRIGLWSAYTDMTFGDWRVELALIPDDTGHEIPGEGAWFELNAPRFRYGAPSDQAAPPMRTVRDRDRLEVTAAGIQVSRFIGSVGMSAVAYSGMDHEPLGRIVVDDNEPVLERYYERRNLLGLNADAAIGSVALRAEFAWQPGKAFNTRSPSGLDSVELDQATLAIGADIFAPLDLFVNVQLQLDNVTDAPPTLVRPDRDRIATAVVRRSFSYETVDVELRLYSSLEDGDRLLSSAVTYEAGSNTEMELRLESFSGNRLGLFGQFSDRDRLIVGIRHFF